MVESLLMEIVYALIGIGLGYGIRYVEVWFDKTERPGDDFGDTLERMKDEIIDALTDDNSEDGP